MNIQKILEINLLSITGERAVAGVLFLFIFLTGFWLSRSESPYPVIAFNIHKLIALGTLVFIAAGIYKIHQAPLSLLQTTAIALTNFCYTATILSGGLLNLDKPLPVLVPFIHKVFPYLTILFTAATLFLLPFIRR
jgi:hypothetical protein